MPENDFPRDIWSYRCPFCRAVTHNPHDIGHRYCGACKAFQADVVALLDLGLQTSKRRGATLPGQAIELAIAAIRTCDRAFNEQTPAAKRTA